MFFSSYLALAAFMVSLVSTKLLIMRLRNSKIFADVPNDRSSHTTPVPKGGGIVIVTTLFIFFLAADSDKYILLLIMLLLAGVSLLDDLIGINPLARLLIHFVGVIAMLQIENFHLFAHLIPSWLDTAIIAIGWVWFINLFNFMDGIDGISASETFCISGGITLVLAFAGLFETVLAKEAIILLGTIAGFWWWNKHPAKIFLGDVGSIPLGFLLGYLLLELSTMGYGSVAAILPAYYVMDATVTLLKRIIEGKKPMEAHKEHFYQQAASLIKHHGIVVQMITGLNLLLIALAHFSVLYPELKLFCIFLAYLVSGFWCLMFKQIRKHLKRSDGDA